MNDPVFVDEHGNEVRNAFDALAELEMPWAQLSAAEFDETVASLFVALDECHANGEIPILLRRDCISLSQCSRATSRVRRRCADWISQFPS